MNIFGKILKALEESRQREADRTIRRYWHLVEQARAYDERQACAYDQRKKLVAGNAADMPQASLMMGAPICDPRT